MKVTEPGLNKLIDNLNTLICEDSLLTRQERETLVLAVAAIGAMKARVGLKKGDAPTVARREKREKKDRQSDPRFPRAGHPWQEEGFEGQWNENVRLWYNLLIIIQYTKVPFQG
ncbi:hypothetical protein ACNG4X_003639, partial [Escherichia coli]